MGQGLITKVLKVSAAEVQQFIGGFWWIDCIFWPVLHIEGVDLRRFCT